MKSLTCSSLLLFLLFPVSSSLLLLGDLCDLGGSVGREANAPPSKRSFLWGPLTSRHHPKDFLLIIGLMRAEHLPSLRLMHDYR